MEHLSMPPFAMLSRMRFRLLTLVACLSFVAAPLAQARGGGGQAQPPAPASTPAVPDDPRVAALKTAAAADIDSMKTFSQQMVDSVFSFGELGFQEVETNRYLIEILRRNGFAVEEGVAGIPTAFIGTWGTGKPVLALGSDIDGIPQA